MSTKYASVPKNYFCKACGKKNDHWIMCCKLLNEYKAKKNKKLSSKQTTTNTSTTNNNKVKSRFLSQSYDSTTSQCSLNSRTPSNNSDTQSFHQNIFGFYNKNNKFKWYDNQQEFENKLGYKLHNFSLNTQINMIDQQKVNDLTNINNTISVSSPHKPLIIFVFGPPAIGKSTIYKYYLNKFGEKDATISHIDWNNFVNTDGEIIRKSHRGINEYLSISTSLNIGYSSYFYKYTQKWSDKWKVNLRNNLMNENKNIISFSTCYKPWKCINEVNKFINNKYIIKVLMICGEFTKCKKYGIKRSKINGRMFRKDGNYIKSMQGSIQVIDELLNKKKIFRKDLIVVKNKYCKKNGEIMMDNWSNLKLKLLNSMIKRARSSMRY